MSISQCNNLKDDRLLPKRISCEHQEMLAVSVSRTSIAISIYITEFLSATQKTTQLANRGMCKPLKVALMTEI